MRERVVEALVVAGTVVSGREDTTRVRGELRMLLLAWQLGRPAWLLWADSLAGVVGWIVLAGGLFGGLVAATLDHTPWWISAVLAALPVGLGVLVWFMIRHHELTSHRQAIGGMGQLIETHRVTEHEFAAAADRIGGTSPDVLRFGTRGRLARRCLPS